MSSSVDRPNYDNCRLAADRNEPIAGTPDFSSAAPITAAVIGGTGSYAAVAGGVTITPTDQANVSTLVVSLERRGW